MFGGEAIKNHSNSKYLGLVLNKRQFKVHLFNLAANIRYLNSIIARLSGIPWKADANTLCISIPVLV